jgi:hypothetical protein
MNIVFVRCDAGCEPKENVSSPFFKRGVYEHNINCNTVN